MIQPIHATLLGIVEGLTEFLPVSSTGHLILVSHLLHLEGDAINTFDIVIQGGALGAVLGLYRDRVLAMWNGLWGYDAPGRKLLTQLVVSFLPAAIVGVLLHKLIQQRLFQIWPVTAALAVGGLVMVIVDRWFRARGALRSQTLNDVTFSQAFMIGLAQCLSLWPGTSRSMVTIVAGMILGLPATVAAEYSFLLALPTLGAATVFDALSEGHALLQQMSVVSVVCGFVAATVVAILAIRGFVRFLTHRGLAIFGWYRIALAAAMWWIAPHV